MTGCFAGGKAFARLCRWGLAAVLGCALFGSLPITGAAFAETQARPAPAPQEELPKGDIGIEVLKLSPQAVSRLGLSQEHALVVVLPVPGGPAEQAGLATGDIILALAGTPISDVSTFRSQIAEMAPGQSLTVQLLRNGSRLALPVRIPASPAPETLAPGEFQRRLIAANASLLIAFPRDAFPTEWAKAQLNIANAYTRLPGENADGIDKAIKAYQAALEVFTADASPRDHVQISRQLAGLFLSRREWDAARQVLLTAKLAFNGLLAKDASEEDARDDLVLAGTLFADLAFAEASYAEAAKDEAAAKAALAIFSEGRAQLPAAALQRQQQLQTLSPLEQAKERALLQEKSELERILDEQESEASLAHSRLSELQNEPGLEAFPNREAGTGPANQIDAIVQAGLLNNAALVATIVTDWGSKFLIVTAANGKPQIRIHDYPGLAANLKALLRSSDKSGRRTGWLADYELQSSKNTQDQDRWFAAVSGIGDKLWHLFGKQLAGELKEAGVKDGARLIILPAASLGLLPLELARDPKSGQRLADTYEVVSEPSLELYLAAARLANRGPAVLPLLAEIIDPTGTLPSARTEASLIAFHFKPKPAIKLDENNATPEVVIAGLRGMSYWHFATHGVFIRDNPRRSGLIMRDGQVLGPHRLADAQGALGAPRLVVLSACETGLYHVNMNPDEFLGLPVTFLELGAAGVIGSLWRVDDVATALLMAKFYELHLGKERLAPPAALRKAKEWLRNATLAELSSFAEKIGKEADMPEPQIQCFLKDLKTGKPCSAGTPQAETASGATRGREGGGRRKRPAACSQDKPFCDPIFWGGFVYTGY